MDSYGMTNVVDRLGEWLILRPEKVSDYIYQHLCAHLVIP